MLSLPQRQQNCSSNGYSLPSKVQPFSDILSIQSQSCLYFSYRSYNFDEFTDVTIAAEDQGIISFVLDDSDTYALVQSLAFTNLKLFVKFIHLFSVKFEKTRDTLMGHTRAVLNKKICLRRSGWFSFEQLLWRLPPEFYSKWVGRLNGIYLSQIKGDANISSLRPYQDCKFRSLEPCLS